MKNKLDNLNRKGKIKPWMGFQKGHKFNIGNQYCLGKKQSEKTKKKRSDTLKKIGHRPPQTRYWLGKKRQEMTGKNHPSWKGGRSMGSNGYWIIGNGKNRKYEHILVMERKLNRRLKKGEVVHHIDGNKLNNQPRNLYLVGRKQHLFYEGNLKNTYLKWIRAEYTT
tara:strand:- start:14 stop:511 length:498 start_codon:yes stop_codon:yes gene_type:complete